MFYFFVKCYKLDAFLLQACKLDHCRRFFFQMCKLDMLDCFSQVCNPYPCAHFSLKCFNRAHVYVFCHTCIARAMQTFIHKCVKRIYVDVIEEKKARSVGNGRDISGFSQFRL